MHFTIVFQSHESYDLSYSLLFLPCPVWVKRDQQLLNLNPERPDYRLGSVRKLISLEKIEDHLAGVKECAIIIHPEGHGTYKDLEFLKKDLLREAFKILILEFNKEIES